MGFWPFLKKYKLPVSIGDVSNVAKWFVFIIVAIAYFAQVPSHATDIPDDMDDGIEPVLAPSEKSQDQGQKKRKTGALDSSSSSPAEVFSFLNTTIKPGSKRTFNLDIHVAGLAMKSPVIITHGRGTGPTVCVSAAIHGDELNGIEIARQVNYGLDPKSFRGTLVSMPVVNLEGFIKQSRYIADRRDLNRFFPGNEQGSTPQRVAFNFFTKIIVKCDALIDLHTGSYYRSNLPQIRADLTDDSVAEMVRGFGGLTVLHSSGVDGMLRVEALKRGIPSVTMEVGGPLRLEPEAVSFGTKAIKHYLTVLGMIEGATLFKGDQPTFYDSKWLRANAAGIFITDVDMGDIVAKGEILGSIVNPITNERTSLTSPNMGTILGKADNQFVAPGYAVFRLGYTKSEKQIQQKAVEEKKEGEKKRKR